MGKHDRRRVHLSPPSIVFALLLLNLADATSNTATLETTPNQEGRATPFRLVRNVGLCTQQMMTQQPTSLLPDIFGGPSPLLFPGLSPLLEETAPATGPQGVAHSTWFTLCVRHGNASSTPISCPLLDADKAEG